MAALLLAEVLANQGIDAEHHGDSEQIDRWWLVAIEAQKS